MHAKHERVDSLIYLNVKVFLKPMCLSILQPNKIFYSSKWCMLRSHIVCHLY